MPTLPSTDDDDDLAAALVGAKQTIGAAAVPPQPARAQSPAATTIAGGANPPTSNLNAAARDMSLTPQETALYQQHLTNLYGPGGVDNPNGSRSTLFAVTAGFGDRTYVVPTVRNGKILSPGDAVQRAK